MSTTRSAIVLLLAAVAARGADPPESVIVRVPVVGSVWGIGGVRWRTDVQLYNDSSRELMVRLSLPATAAPEFLFSMPPGATQRFTDIAAEAFSTDSVLSPLEIETFESKRPVRVSATVYGVRGTDVFSPEPIPVDYGGGNYYPQRSLHGLSFSDTFRTNIGLANLGQREATFLLALQRLPGRNVAVTRITLQPNALTHASIQSLFPLITKGDNFTVIVETGARDTYVYASVIDNASNEARFIQPAIGAPTLSAQGMTTAKP
ncbi:MAG: hypothetical protein AABO58_06300 [Acidobacteriota bacterium]